MFFTKKSDCDCKQYEEILTYIKRINGLMTKSVRINIENYDKINDYLFTLDSKLRKIDNQINSFNNKINDGIKKIEQYNIKLDKTSTQNHNNIQSIIKDSSKNISLNKDLSFQVIYAYGIKNISPQLLENLKIINRYFYQTFGCWELLGYIPTWALSYLLKNERIYKLNITRVEKGKYDYNHFKKMVKASKCNEKYEVCRKLLSHKKEIIKMIESGEQRIKENSVDLELCEVIATKSFVYKKNA